MYERTNKLYYESTYERTKDRMTSNYLDYFLFDTTAAKNHFQNCFKTFEHPQIITFQLYINNVVIQHSV